MAIKVNGTTVIDDSRNLVNIASGAGSSTTLYDVGTYLFARHGVADGELERGETTAGSNLAPSSADGITRGTRPSGTWRTMGFSDHKSGDSRQRTTLFVRIS